MSVAQNGKRQRVEDLACLAEMDLRDALLALSLAQDDFTKLRDTDLAETCNHLAERINKELMEPLRSKVNG